MKEYIAIQYGDEGLCRIIENKKGEFISGDKDGKGIYKYNNGDIYEV